MGMPIRGVLRLNRRPLVRSLLASAAIAAALALAGCDTDGVVPAGRSLAPLSAQMLSDIDKKNMTKESAILVRLFKEESELEVWKEDKDGRFALLKTYPICRWSGELGPKIKMGDRQAPEGFYTITPGLMNPNSNYYLAINTGFPNAFDRANERTGNFLMIHGDCSSAGCYAMTDEQIQEIYALARESFFGGQRAFQIQAFPFKMTPLNMAKHRNSPHMAFWRMIKQGYDHFEVTRQEPKVDVCEKRYVFDAETTAKFTPAGKCPVFKVNEDLVAAVKEKQQRDDNQMAELVSRGTSTVPIRTGLDGGMHAVFQAALKPAYTDAAGIVRTPTVSLPGTIPAHARLPGADGPTGSVVEASRAPARVALAPQNQEGSATGSLFGNLFSSNDKSQPSSGSMMERVSRAVGLGSTEPTPATPAPKSKAAAKPVQTAAKPTPQQAEAKPTATASAVRPTAKTQEAKVETKAEPPAKSVDNGSLLSGAQPTVPAGTFDGRWGNFR
jgi:murein L,D-transpeptidase YafK